MTLLALFTAVCGVFVGNELGTGLVVHPALRKLEVEANVAAERVIYRGEARWVPFLMIGSMGLAFASSGATDGRASTLCLIAGGLLVLVIAITLMFNMPLNIRIMNADASTDPDEFRSWRRRWDRFHYLRLILDVGALGLAVWATAG